MSRRVGVGLARRGSLRGTAYSLFAGVLALSATRPVFNADLYVIDGGSGKTRAVVDHNDIAHWLGQANTTLQCALPAANAGFANALCLAFTGGEYYDSNRAIGLWPWTVDGTGYDFHGAVSATHGGARVVWSAAWNSGVGGRGALYLNTTSWLQRVLSPDVTYAHTCVTSASDTATRLHCAYDEAQSPEVRLQDNNLALATTTTTGAASAPSGLPFRVGDFSSGGGRYIGIVRSLLFFPTLTEAQRNIPKQYIQQDTGIAA